MLANNCRSIVRACIAVGRFILCTLAVGGILLLPSEAWAWGKRAHVRIAELALQTLPPAYRSQLAAYKNDIFQATKDKSGNKGTQAVYPSNNSQVSSDIQLLMVIPHSTADLSHYFAYRLGEIGCSVADMALPFSYSGASDKSYREDFENDIDGDVESFSIRTDTVSPTCLAYPDIQLERISREARKSEGLVRTSYLGGKGYASCRNVVSPSFKTAVETVANVWFTILTNEPAPAALSSPTRVTYYTNQIRYSCEKDYLDDAYSALHALRQEGRRVPLTAAFVGDEFFNLPPSIEARRIYDLAALIDPQCSSVSDRKKACDEYLQKNLEKENERSVTRRKIPPGGNMRVYQKINGVLLITDKVKSLGPDYVSLNFEPISKITSSTTKKTTRRITKETVEIEAQPEVVDLEEIINRYSRHYSVSPALVKAVIRAESNFDPYAVSSAGASGLMQLMPSTALEMQVEDIFDPEQNVAGGCQYLSQMLELFNDNIRLALAAYNAGPGSVLHYGGMPPFKETREYVPRVLTYYEQYRNSPSPILVKVASNRNTHPGYSQAEEMTIESELREVREEVLVSSPRASKRPKAADENVTIILKNGNPMRGQAYEKTSEGKVRLKFKNGWIDIREEFIEKISTKAS